MAFWGKSFVFDGIPCETFDLMVYNIESNNQGDTQFAGVTAPIEESLPYLWKPILLGTKYDSKLTFDIIFGTNPDRIDVQQYLDRYDLDAIATWLIGHTDYKWLMIQQDDMTFTRYRCMITDLAQISYGLDSVAFKATVTCDSAFAYSCEEHYTFTLTGDNYNSIMNYSSLHSYYKPVIVYTPNGSNSLRIRNVSDDSREFILTDLPSSTGKITIDCAKCIISCESKANLYKNCNYLFPRLVRGDNRLLLSGKGKLEFICSYPINAV